MSAVRKQRLGAAIAIPGICLTAISVSGFFPPCFLFLFLISAILTARSKRQGTDGLVFGLAWLGAPIVMLLIVVIVMGVESGTKRTFPQAETEQTVVAPVGEWSESIGIPVGQWMPWETENGTITVSARWTFDDNSKKVLSSERLKALLAGTDHLGPDEQKHVKSVEFMSDSSDRKPVLVKYHFAIMGK